MALAVAAIGQRSLRRSVLNLPVCEFCSIQSVRPFYSKVVFYHFTNTTPPTPTVARRASPLWPKMGLRVPGRLPKLLLPHEGRNMAKNRLRRSIRVENHGFRQPIGQFAVAPWRLEGATVVVRSDYRPNGEDFAVQKKYHTTFFRYHTSSKKFKKSPNTGTIPVNSEHWRALLNYT